MRLNEAQISKIQELVEDEWWNQPPPKENKGRKRIEGTAEIRQSGSTTYLDVFVGRKHVAAHRIFKNGKSRPIKGTKK